MHLSKYTLIKEGFPKERFVLLYNTLRKGVAILNQTDFIKLENDKEEEIDDEILKKLKSEGFIVNDDDDEMSKLNMFFTMLKSSYYAYASMILTSYDCNMKCPYCFENAIKSRHETMSIGVAKDVANWLCEEFKKYQPNNVGLAFSGGEPLINKDAIILIVKKVKKYCDSKGLNFSYGFLTNGTIPITEDEAEFF